MVCSQPQSTWLRRIKPRDLATGRISSGIGPRSVWRSCAALILWTCAQWAAPAHAVEESDIGQRLRELGASLSLLEQDPKAMEQARSRGEERAVFCKTCHGSDGISRRDWIPNLAGQNKKYLLEQILAYAAGSRKDYVMNQLASDFTDEDIVNLTLFYASLPNEQITPTGDPARVRSGGELYARICQACHGKDGRGSKGYTWIAGQKPEYVRHALQRYREGSGERTDPTMAAVTHKLTDQEIDHLATYLSTLD